MKVLVELSLSTYPFVGRAAEVQQMINEVPDLTDFVWEAVENHFRFIGKTPTIAELTDFVAHDLPTWLEYRGIWKQIEEGRRNE